MKCSKPEPMLHISNLLPKDLVDRSRTDSARRRNPQVQRSYIIPVLSKALIVMEILKVAERPLNITELVDRTGISKTTVYRILRTLSAYGYLPDGSEGVYSFRHVPCPPELMPARRDSHDLGNEYIDPPLCN
jgi:IclR helix-turn-helix domain